jgi:tRNA dimethylallyltransferase
VTGKPSKTLIVLAGPTAVGKTDVAIRLARHLGTEIISADARQVYKELEIGTAKPSPSQLAEVPHHFISSHSIHDDYNAAMYGEEALALLKNLFTKHDRVVLCGGSGLYIRAILEGFDDIPEIDKNIRSTIADEYKAKGLAWLQEEVKRSDPDYFEVVDQKNPHRLIRSLEITRATGIKMADWRKRSKRENDFRVVKIGLTLPVEELFEEAAKLYPHRELQALQTVGYREIFAFMDHSYDREEAVRLLKRNTRHYAKRQMTWFRKDTEFTWQRPDQWDEIVNLALIEAS